MSRFRRPAGYLPDYDAITARLRAVPGVVRAAPIVDGQVMANQNGYNSGAMVRGMRVRNGFGQPDRLGGQRA